MQKHVKSLICHYSVANATADLLVIGAWSCVLDIVSADPIPVRYNIAVIYLPADLLRRHTILPGMIAFLEHSKSVYIIIKPRLIGQLRRD